MRDPMKKDFGLLKKKTKPNVKPKQFVEFLFYFNEKDNSINSNNLEF